MILSRSRGGTGGRGGVDSCLYICTPQRRQKKVDHIEGSEENERYEVERSQRPRCMHVHVQYVSPPFGSDALEDGSPSREDVVEARGSTRRV